MRAKVPGPSRLWDCGSVKNCGQARLCADLTDVFQAIEFRFGSHVVVGVGMRFEACLNAACVGLAGLVSGRDVPYDPSWSKVYNEIDSRRLLSPEKPSTVDSVVDFTP